jgi:transposase
MDDLQPVIASIEDQMYQKQHQTVSQKDLFQNDDLDIVFFDTTSTHVKVKMPSELIKRGYNKDHRPDIPQLIIGLVLTSKGDPLCHFTYPGNTADIKAFKESLIQVRKRFPIKRIILVADRGTRCRENLPKNYPETVVSKGIYPQKEKLP